MLWSKLSQFSLNTHTHTQQQPKTNRKGVNWAFKKSHNLVTKLYPEDQNQGEESNRKYNIRAFFK